MHVKNDADIKLVKEIIRLNEVSDIQSAEEQLNRKKQFNKILDEYLRFRVKFKLTLHNWIMYKGDNEIKFSTVQTNISPSSGEEIKVERL